MSFTVICNECGSKNVKVEADMDFVTVITCRDCGQVRHGDDFKEETK